MFILTFHFDDDPSVELIFKESLIEPCYNEGIPYKTLLQYTVKTRLIAVIEILLYTPLLT